MCGDSHRMSSGQKQERRRGGGLLGVLSDGEEAVGRQGIRRGVVRGGRGMGLRRTLVQGSVPSALPSPWRMGSREQ